jgi:hypothetical protein
MDAMIFYGIEEQIGIWFSLIAILVVSARTK